MCKCTPELKTPFCGKGDCKFPPPEYYKGFMLLHKRSGRIIFQGGISDELEEIEPHEIYKDEYEAVSVKVFIVK